MPADLQPEFERAMAAAAELAVRAIREHDYADEDFVAVLQAAAELHGRQQPGRVLGCLHHSSLEIDCPGCGGYLCGDPQGDEIFLQALDRHGKPLSHRAWIRAAAAPTVECDDTGPSPDDFAWLLALCRLAHQPRVTAWISALYGTGTCPLCGTEFVPMTQY
jgi:hypothetical protein